MTDFFLTLERLLQVVPSLLLGRDDLLAHVMAVRDEPTGVCAWVDLFSAPVMAGVLTGLGLCSLQIFPPTLLVNHKDIQDAVTRFAYALFRVPSHVKGEPDEGASARPRFGPCCMAFYVSFLLLI